MGTLSIWHWLIVLLVVSLIFGTKKLRGMGSDLSGAVRDFKEGMSSDREEVRERQASGSSVECEIKNSAVTSN